MSDRALTQTDAAPPRGLATAALACLAGAILLTWLPDYLTWPWWPDTDAWATMAQGWDSGRRPYRDVACFNFPGPIELCWLLSKLFGWGRTAPYYAADAAMLGGLGGLLAAWSRRGFASAWPGLVGWLAALAMYCGLDYSMVAQRDWQGPLLACSSVLVLQGWRGRVATLLSAALMAAGFVIRPHVVLFGAPILAVLACRCDSRPEAVRRGAWWGVAFVVFAMLAFSPLVAQGLISDLVRGVRQASYGSGYGGGGVTPARIAASVARQLGLAPPEPGGEPFARMGRLVSGWKVLATVAGLAIAATVAGPDRRKILLPWLAALVVMLFYAPLHPKPHGYLVLPLRLVWAIAWGVLAGATSERIRADRPGLRFAAGLGFVVIAVPGVPAFCRPVESFGAAMGRPERGVPATARRFFAPDNPNTPYTWDDYRRLLLYMRSRTGPETRVATVLRNVPFPSINGTLGRVSPLPAESGIIWLWSVNPRMERDFVAAIEAMPAGAVVVWAPGESAFAPELRLEAISAAIRRGFRPEARFGAFEVWRRAARRGMEGD